MKPYLPVMIIVCLAACAAPTPETVEVTRVSIQTVEVTQIITTTPLPTYTPYPTYTPMPSPTPTPIYQLWTPEQVISAFQEQGLECESAYLMTEEDYGMAPRVDTAGWRFLIPSLCADCGGRIFTFANANDLNILKSYYDAFGQSSRALFSWTFVKDNILVQINGDLPEEKADQYRSALDSLH